MRKNSFLLIIIILTSAISLICCSKKNPVDITDDVLPVEKKDYFPLTIGNSWTYDYLYHTVDYGDADENKSGVLNWTIVNKTTNNNVDIYTIEEIFQGTKINSHLYLPLPSDTTTVGPDTFYFAIYDSIGGNQNHILSINSPFTRYFNFTYKDSITRFNPVEYKKYVPHSGGCYRENKGDLIEVQPKSFLLTRILLNVNVGITYWNSNHSSNLYINEEIKLKTYKIIE